MLAAPVIDQIVRTIAERLSPRRVVLCGSHARRTATDAGHIDLVVEVDGDAPMPERYRVVAELYPKRPCPMHVHVDTPREGAGEAGDVGTLLYVIEREGTELYRRPGLAAPSDGAPGDAPARPSCLSSAPCSLAPGS